MLNVMASRSAQATSGWYYVLFFLTLALTAACYLIVYADWSMPMLSQPFLGTFSRVPWLRISFILTTVTFPFPFSALYRAEDQRKRQSCVLSSTVALFRA